MVKALMVVFPTPPFPVTAIVVINSLVEKNMTNVKKATIFLAEKSINPPKGG
jgi:hypothetical protein